MEKVLKLISQQSVVWILYGVSLALVVVAMSIMFASISAGQLIAISAMLLLAMALPITVMILNIRAHNQLLIQACNIAKQYHQGVPVENDIYSPLSYEPVQNFLETFTKLVDQASTSQGLFGDVAMRLADDAKKLSQVSVIMVSGMHELENRTFNVKNTFNTLLKR